MNELYIFALKYKGTDFYNSFIIELGYVEGTIFRMCFNDNKTFNEIAKFMKEEYSDPRINVNDVKDILNKIAIRWKKYLMYIVLYKNVTIVINR